MEDTSAAGTSVARRVAPDGTPPCVRTRAQELFDLAVLRILALFLCVTAGVQAAALLIAVLSPPHLLYIPEAAR